MRQEINEALFHAERPECHTHPADARGCCRSKSAQRDAGTRPKCKGCKHASCIEDNSAPTESEQ